MDMAESGFIDRLYEWFATAPAHRLIGTLPIKVVKDYALRRCGFSLTTVRSALGLRCTGDLTAEPGQRYRTIHRDYPDLFYDVVVA